MGEKYEKSSVGMEGENGMIEGPVRGKRRAAPRIQDAVVRFSEKV